MYKPKLKRHRKSATAIFLFIIQVITCYFATYVQCQEVTLNEIENVDSFARTKQNTHTDLPGGSIDGKKMLRLAESPYSLQSDLIIERTGTLIVEPGVTVYAAPMVGITVRGAISALVSIFFCILFVYITVSLL